MNLVDRQFTGRGYLGHIYLAVAEWQGDAV